MHVRRISLAITALGLIAFIAGIAIAQLNEGNAQITVSNPCSQVMPGVSVTLEVGGAPQAKVTDAQGHARYDGLPSGTYTARAEMEGYAPNTAPITVQAGETATAGIALQPAICEDTDSDETCCSKLKKKEDR